ncbi:MAG: hypothetical protein SVV88_08780 [Pseudomonadota bacterium]|nr:hypothetical protein [Pseudomonadota bacterium]
MVEIIKKWDWIDEGIDCKVYRLQKGDLQADWIDKNNEIIDAENTDEKKVILEEVWESFEDEGEVFPALSEDNWKDSDYLNRPVFS